MSIRWNPPPARLACCLAWLPSWLARSRVRLPRSLALSWAWVAVSPTLSLARPARSPAEVPSDPSRGRYLGPTATYSSTSRAYSLVGVR